MRRATRVLFFIQMDSPAWHSRIQLDKRTHIQTQRHTVVQSKKKKGKRWRKKTWIPPVVCVLEQVNSLYSRIAITSTLQQGCSWLELNAVWLDQTRGLFFSLFVKMQIWPAFRCKNSYCLRFYFSNFCFFSTENSPPKYKTVKYALKLFINIHVLSLPFLNSGGILFYFLKTVHWTSGSNMRNIEQSINVGW